MEIILVFLSLAAVVSCIQYDGLRVKFGWTEALADKEHFFSFPRTISDVENEGWLRTERPPGPLPELRMYCPRGRIVCPLYSSAGFVAGLMIALPIDELASPAGLLEKNFIKWSAPAADGEPAREYWTATQYYVSAESLKAGAGPQVENGATLQDGGVWVAGHDKRLIRVPSTEAELYSTAFKKQNCIPNMGTHYYYNMTTDLSCEDLLPWFAVTTGGDLVGVGFQFVGKLPKQERRDWFESVPIPKQATQVTIPFAPDCLGEWAENYGIVSMHIYFVNDPWNIQCKTGDSIKPARLDLILLDTSRYYVTKISDEVAKLLSGFK